LHAGFAVESHDLAFRQCAVPAKNGIPFVHNADAALRNEHNAKKPEELAVSDHYDRQHGCPPIRRKEVEHGLGGHNLSLFDELQAT
jgi:hypothetical protein